MDRARDWGTRITHEASLHEATSFLTLTYSDEHLPADNSVSVREVQLFMKRLRKECGSGIRYFACGEYGGGLGRPHYHILLFGADFASDRTPWRMSATGFQQYRSARLERLWPFGFCEIGTVTVESAQYVARYIFKKVNGKAASDHYKRVDPFTGEVQTLRPEFITMSTRPGLGAEWFRRFQTDAFPKDFCTIEGQKRPIPRYYMKRLKAKEAPDALAPTSLLITSDRIHRAQSHAENNTPERLATREQVLDRKLRESLKRELDDL